MTRPEQWESRAEENIERWGNQPPAVLLLALCEEIAEVADELLATSKMPLTHQMESSEASALLAEVRSAGFACRSFLESEFEDADGNPLPDSEVPTLVDDLDEERVLAELDDAAPLVYQLSWALEAPRESRSTTCSEGPRR